MQAIRRNEAFVSGPWQRAGMTLLVLALLGAGAPAQEPSQAPGGPGAAVAAAVPQQVRYDGKLPGRAGDTVEAVFSVYAAAQGGEPLWTETQRVPVDGAGGYSIVLGAASPAGLPQSLFAGGEARWLGVSVERAPEQDRVLLTSVPYAMKAADAETLGGVPAAQFVTQARLDATTRALESVASSAELATAHPDATPSGGGTADTIALWTNATTLGNSAITQIGVKPSIGIDTTTPASTLDVNGAATVRGNLSLPPAKAATTASPVNSPEFEIGTSAYNSTSAGAVTNSFVWQAIATGNNTATPSAVLSLDYSAAGANPIATGFSICSKGLINFAAGQKFPGTGAGTLTGITTTSPLTGGGATGSVALGLNLTALETKLSTVYAGLLKANTFTGNQTVTGNFTATKAIAGASIAATGAVTGATASFTGAATVGGNQSVMGTSTVAGAASFKSGISVSGPAATATLSQPSPVLALEGNAYSSASHTSQAKTFALETVPTGNDTTTPSANLDVLFGSGSATPAPTGLSIAPNGLITFAPGQIFPGAGISPIAAITTASPLTGGGNTGTIALGLNETALVTAIAPAMATAIAPTIATDITPTLQSTYNGVYAQLGAVNTFTNPQIIEGSTVIAASVEEGSGLEVTNSGDAFSTAISASNGGKYGVGLSVSSSSNGYGIEGFGTQSAGSIGVLGALSNSNGFSNSYFLLESDDGLDAGVWADGANGQEAALIATSDDLSAGIFFNDSASSSTIVVLNNYSGGPTGNIARGIGTVLRAGGPGGTCGINQSGDVACTGQVKSLVTSQDGARQMETYAVQSSESWIEDYGSAQLAHGSATISLDPAFAETVNTGVEFHVFLTPGDDCKGLYVSHKTGNSFEVHELGGGTASIPFDYKIVAKRRGMEAERLVDVTAQMKSEAEAARFRALAQPLPKSRMPQPIRPRIATAVSAGRKP